MSLELGKMSASIKVARDKVRQYCGPFTIYFAEHFSNCARQSYCRTIINLTREGAYKAIRCDIDLSYPKPIVQVKELGIFREKHIALGKLNEETTCLEQSDYLFIDECHKVPFDVKSKLASYQEARLKCYSLNTFHQRYKNLEALVQFVEKGMHMTFVVDEFADVWFRPVGYKDKLAWTKASNEHAQVVLENLAKVDGALGFVGEGFFDGLKIILTDIIFLKDKWLFDLKATQRMDAFRQLVDGLAMVKPSIAEYQKVKASDIRKLCSSHRALIISTPQATQSVTNSANANVYRALVVEHEPFDAYFGVKKSASHSELFDYDDFSYKGLAYHNLKIDIKGLTFKACLFQAGKSDCALYC